MKLFISPRFGKEAGQGGIKRVVEAQNEFLPALGVEIVQSPGMADVVNSHATEVVDHPVQVLSCHGLYWTGYDWPEWAYRANRIVVNAMLDASAVTVPSHWVAHSVRRGTLVDPVVCQHGVRLEEWTPRDGGGYVLWAKNRPDAICTPDPLMKLAEMAPKIPFVSTFGDAKPNVKIVGMAPFSEIKPLIENASVYLGTVMETGGITVLEAMAAGVPVLGWSWGANRELVTHEETGYLVEPGDYDGLLEGLHYCVENRARLGSAARQYVADHHQWKQVIPNYLTAYQQALEQERRHREGPAVSVIVTAYKLEEYLPGCIESVLEQSFDNWELVIIDDASPDRCGQIADEYAAREPRIRVIHNRTNRYLAEARNIAIRESRGQFILPLDADDRLAPNALAILVETLYKDSRIAIATGSMKLVEEDGREWVSGWPTKTPSYDQQIKERNQVPYASAYRRWVWERTGGYRRRMKTAEDADFWTRAMSFGARPAKVTDMPTLVYSNRSASMSHSIAPVKWTAWFPWAVFPNMTPYAAASDTTDPSRRVHTYGPPQVTVVIPCGPGHELFLQDALDSLVAQTFLDWEVVVVNDTGKRWLDKTGKRCVPYLDGHPYARIVDSAGSARGVAWARNMGFKEAASPLVVLLDADDFFQPLALEVLLQVYRRYGGWVYCDWLDDTSQPKAAQSWSFNGLLSKMLGPITGLYAVSDWKDVGGFDETISGWEDWLFQIALLRQGICGTRIAEPLFTYRYKAGQRREENYERAAELLAVIRKKQQQWFESEEIKMACTKCGRGGGHVDVRMGLDPRSPGKVNSPSAEAEFVLIEYVGPQTQFQHLRSKANPRRRYRYGGPQGTPGRKFYVYAADADWLLDNKDFRKVSLAPVQNPAVSSPAPVLDAPAQPYDPPDYDGLPVTTLDVAPEVIGILRRAGFETVGSLRTVPAAELTAIKGLGPARVRKVQDALAAVV